MSEDIITEPNDQLLLIVGESTAGKSASLREFATGSEEEQKKFMYLNCEAGKRLPFRNKFDEYKIVDPYQIYEALDHFNTSNEHTHLCIDTLTFLLDMYESMYIHGSADGRTAWGNFQQYFKTIMQTKVSISQKPIIFLAHTREDLDEAKGQMKSSVPVKGALKNNGIEAYFSTVVAAKRVTIKELEKYDSDLLTINDEEREVGYKHVFQTKITKSTTGERIRAPMGLFTRNQTYIDNDAKLLLQHLHKFYN